MIETLEPQPDNVCFGCGGGNAGGLQLAFELDHQARRVTARWVPDAVYQGSGGILHGGVIALLFDEAMAKLSRLHGVRAVTAELKVNYLRPVPCGDEVVIAAWEVERTGRNLNQEAELRDAGGVVLARARARFVTLGPQSPKLVD